jgi:peroxiredoxin
MALTESNPFAIGTQAPNFTLLNTVSGDQASLSNLKGEKGTAIFFICNHCPFVIHVNSELVRMANEYTSKGIGFIAISSNNVETHPQDGPEYMKKHAEKVGYPFAYLYDESQDVAKAYDATCTPDLYLFDAELKSVYHGQLDDSRPGNAIPVNGADFRDAMNALLAGKENTSYQKPSIGCGIKWKM